MCFFVYLSDIYARARTHTHARACVCVVCIHLDGDSAQLVEHRTGMLLRRARVPGAARDFSPRVNSDMDYRNLNVRTKSDVHA